MKIREFLTEANWGRGPELAHGEKECLLTALCHCGQNQHERDVAIEKILDAIGCGSIMAWNDAPERTFAEVKALVERLDI